MINGGRNTQKDSGWIDYLLSATLGGLALFCCGEGVGQPVAGAILIGIYCCGTAFSYFTGKKLRGTKSETWDAPLYGVAALISIFGQGFLAQLLPADTFPPELRSAAYISWLLSLGSFAGWRDATRLFQAVPALALFGLVGVYDTYSNVTFVFFGFLLCLALMFGRAHARSMLLQATRSGFARIDEGLSLSEAAVEQDGMLRAMRRGPWRWMAGPEWAVGSAGAVILISLLGAPIIHESVQGVAGYVRINVPARLRQAQNSVPPLSAASLTMVGLGPRKLSPQIIGNAVMDKDRYLRTDILDHYTAGGWTQSITAAAPDTDTAEARQEALKKIQKPHYFDFQVTLVDPGSLGWIPAPAEVTSISSPTDAKIDRQGKVYASSNHIEGTAVESSIDLSESAPAANLVAGKAKEEAASGQVIELARQATANCHNDYEKAFALMQAIDQKAKYNLKAAAVPRTEDPVEYFLFQSHEGYCDLFASAMVEMARAAGMDAHYVTGYLTSDQDMDQYHRYIIRQSNAHAWAEIYFNGIGWVVFDATTNAEDITPKDDGMGGMNWTWVPIAIGLGLLAGAVYYLPRWRFALKLPGKAIEQRKLDTLYTQFARDLGRRAKLRKSPSETPDHWLERTKLTLGPAAAAEAEKVNKMFVAALYSPEPMSPEKLLELKKSMRDFRRARN